MESPNGRFESTDVMFHSRDQRPTQSFERALENARAKGSKVVRVYGKPRFVLDPRTGFIYMGIEFAPEILKKIQRGELIMKQGTPWVIDEETRKKMADKEKRKLKNSTRSWWKWKP